MDRRQQAMTLKNGGLTPTEIGEILGVSKSRVSFLCNKDSNEQHAKSAKKWYRKHSINTTEGRIYVEKRDRPNNCELCGRLVDRLDYHHWDKANPRLGLWLCISCHIFAERVDRDMVDKYLALKGSIG